MPATEKANKDIIDNIRMPDDNLADLGVELPDFEPLFHSRGGIAMRVYRCPVCGYLHTGELGFHFCPVCGSPAEIFGEETAVEHFAKLAALLLNFIFRL